MRFINGIIIVIVGLTLIYIFGLPWFVAWSSFRWNKVPAEKLDARVNACNISGVRVPGHPGFEIKASYTYLADGKRVASDCVSIVGSKYRQRHDADLACQKILEDRVVYYSDFFGRSCLIPGAGNGRFLIGVGLGVFFCIIGGVLFLFPVRR